MPKPTVPLPTPTAEAPQTTTSSEKEINSAKAARETPTKGLAGLPSAKSEPVVNNYWSPTLQNVLEQPPAAFPRQLLLGGMIFCLAFIGWTWLGKIEEVGHARGRLVPQGEAYKIHPVDAGKVVRINVKEGDVVKAGQVLVEMDTQIVNSEVERFQQMVKAYQDELRQKQALIDKTHQEANTRSQLNQASIKVQEALLSAAKAKAATSRQLLAQVQTEKTATHTRLSRLKPLSTLNQKRLKQLQSDVAAHQERVNRLKKLVADGAIAKEYLFDAEQALRDRQAAITESQLSQGAVTDERLFNAQQMSRDRASAMTEQQGELKQSIVEIESLQAQLSQKIAEANITQLEAQQRIQELEVEKTQLKSQIADTQNLLNQARTQLVQKFLHAPVDGTVSSFNIRNVGEVVQQGQTIAEIAPKTAPLVLEASLPNQEAGFIKLGMPVQVKLDAFPYQDFGVVSGKVTSISPDAKTDERLGPVYRVEVALDRNYVAANQQTIPFKAGQTATADIIIRRRRIVDVLLEPFRQLQKGGINL